MDQQAPRAPGTLRSARLSATALCLVALVRVYQATLRPFFGGHCRFQPTCSEYALQALQRHGAGRGSWLAARRLLRCHPLGGAGYDPVPEDAGGVGGGV